MTDHNIKVFIPISEASIKALTEVYSEKHPDKKLTIDEDRLQAALGMEISLFDIVTCDTEEESFEFTKFIMGITATVTNYLHLI